MKKKKINETIINIPKEILLTHFLRHVCQLIKQAKEKEISEKCIRITKTLKDVIIIIIKKQMKKLHLKNN